MLVSVVVPVYNQNPDYFQAALHSAKRSLQGFPFEILVCDDGSDHELSSKFISVSDEVGANYFRLHSNFGMNVARNLAVLRATGDYVLLLDSDDLLVGDWEAMLTQVSEQSPLLAFADHCQFDHEMKVRLQDRQKSDYFSTYNLYANTPFDPFLHSTFLFHPQIYRRDALLASGGFDCAYSSGDEIALQLKILRGQPPSCISYFPAELYRYRKNPASVVHDPHHYKDLIQNIQAILQSEFKVRFGLNVSVAWTGRESRYGAAHYEVIDTDSGLSIRPCWFDFETKTLRL